MLRSAWLFAFLVAYVLAQSHTRPGFSDVDRVLDESELRELAPLEEFQPLAVWEPGLAHGPGDDDNDIEFRDDQLQTGERTVFETLIITEPEMAGPTRPPLPPRKVDEEAPAQKAEVAGMARFMGADESSDGDDFLIVVNEFKGRSIVRQSVCYESVGPNPDRIGFVARCYDMSDYDVILGTPETLTTNQYYILRDRVENMLEDGNPLRQTMIASSYRLYNSVPFLLNFLGVRWQSMFITIGNSQWSNKDSSRGPSDKSIVTWRPPYELSRAIRPYFWDEPRRVINNTVID